jgi:hypothetical protein
MSKKITFNDLYALKEQSMSNILGQAKLPTWYDYVITADTTRDVEMSVWNGTHPVDDNMTKHICPAGTKVRIWMVSRFGDAGITDNLVDPKGYDARNIDVDKDLVNITLTKVKS